MRLKFETFSRAQVDQMADYAGLGEVEFVAETKSAPLAVFHRVVGYIQVEGETVRFCAQKSYLDSTQFFMCAPYDHLVPDAGVEADRKRREIEHDSRQN